MNHIYKIWKFDFAGSDPGIHVSHDGIVASRHDQQAVRQSIMMLLSTNPGERIMRPDYGCELHRIVFMPNDPSTAGLAMHYVRKAIEKWEQRVTIDHLDADPDPENPERLIVTLRYTIKKLNVRDEVQFSADLS